MSLRVGDIIVNNEESWGVAFDDEGEELAAGLIHKGELVEVTDVDGEMISVKTISEPSRSAEAVCACGNCMERIDIVLSPEYEDDI